MKKKLIAWLTARVDAVLVTEAWERKRWAEQDFATMRERADQYEVVIDRLTQENAKLLAERAALNQELYG